MTNVIDQIIEENQDLIKLHEEKDALIAKTCDNCGKALHGEETKKDTSVAFDDLDDNEFITMMSISHEYGGVGSLSHTCGECLKNQHNMPS